MKITEGIYLIPEMGMSNAYLVEDGDKLLVIDTGMPGHAQKIINYIKSLGKDPRSVETIVLTHPDLDHSGSTAQLKQLTGAKVAIHEADAPRLSGEKPWREAKGAAGFMMRVLGLFFKLQPVPPDISLKEGDELGPLIVFETPGHTMGSISLYKPGTALFSGDALLTNGKRLFQKPSRMMNAEQGKESIRRMATLEFEYLVPGHGAPVEGNASEKLKNFVDGEL
jgi:glyoxylase-like metal-dependent hydrolase (beta-lactamase superfamily II)